jgi:hypothetical protein
MFTPEGETKGKLTGVLGTIKWNKIAFIKSPVEYRSALLCG